MIPEKNRQEWIDAIFEEELHAKPRDENFKPKLASGGYVTGMTVWGTNTTGTTYSTKVTSVHDTFNTLSVSITYASGEMDKLNKALGKIGEGWWTDGA